MKKNIVVILFILQLSCAKPPQDSVTLEIHYKPETKYHYTSEQTLQSVINYTGKQKALQELKKRGIQNPGITNKTITVEAILKTGKLDNESYFPVKVEYIRILKNDEEEEFPINATIHGKCLNDQQPVFDILIAEGLDKKYKMALLESWQNTFSQLSFPGEKIKVGEQFSSKSPYLIPMEGSEIEMTVKTHYKLISIKDGMADFDISQQYTMNPRLMDNSFKGTVKGEGHMVYDISNRIALNYILKTEMVLHKNLDSFEFELKTMSGFIQKMNISPE
ncbi:MAG TPA: hypothetical protein VFG54_03330 [Prolixibacteraceae bacterium]|nr:hypothetical protein [Prolixibacteraceae bacterium]